MTEFNKWTCLTYRAAAEAAGVSLWRLRYAVESGYLPPPVVVLKRRPLFSPDQLAAIRRYFEQEDSHRHKMSGVSRQSQEAERSSATDRNEETSLGSR